MPAGKKRDVTTDLLNLGKNLQSVTEDLGSASTEKEELTSEVMRTRRALDAARKELYEHSKRHQLMDEETVELNAKAVKKENEVVVRGNELQSLENEVSLCLS
ncbi:hypothetical protein T484DRAFT_1741908 [Baffinella frigidus]|nr:hypothetical protein T484DRAFT_1741908 [Cryptophyta sp. CCMP2293]